MAKRTSLKGMGASIFEPGAERPEGEQASKEARQRTGTPARHHTSRIKKATFYLPEQTLDRLEAVWIAARGKKPAAKVSKSELVTSALDTFLREQGAAGK